MVNESMNMVVSGMDYDVDEHLHYTQVKVNDRGGKNVNVLNKKGMKSTLISTPLMLTWGVNEFEDENSKKKTYDLALQFPSADYPNEEAEKFLENMKKLESQIKKDAVAHSKEWFNKAKMSEDVVEALWTPMLKYPKDKATGDFDYTRAPTLKVKIPFWNGTFNTEVFNTNGDALFPDPDGDESVTPKTLVTKSSKIATIIKNGGIWFANGKFGTTWKLEQAMVQPRATIRGKCHIQLNQDEVTEMDKQNTKLDEQEDEVSMEKAPHVTSTEVNDSDDEEPKPTTPPPVKKKRVVKKKVTASDYVEEE